MAFSPRDRCLTAVVFVAAWLFFVAGCGTNGTGSDGGASDGGSVDAVACNAPTPLASCVNGWQFGPLPNPCPCTVNNKPECANPDCQELDVYGYLDGGTEIEGIIYYSAKAGTMSTWSPVLKGTWSIVDGGILETLSGGKVACATCDSVGGVCYNACEFGNSSTEIPASVGWSAALDSALDAGTTWTAWPVTP